MERHDVAIVGGGPAGLAAALRLVELGIKDVVVLEREAEAGGIPRHCGHMGFGWQSHRRLWTGPRFAAQLRADTSSLDVRTGTTVLELGPEGHLRIRDSQGARHMIANRVLIATGTRETPRAARLVGGTRPQGVMTTGALQQHVYLNHRRPFDRPVIVGSEWVSFSVLVTCLHLGVRPVAMIEENAATTAPRAGRLVARLAFGVPVLTATRLIAIDGRGQVEAVEVEHGGQRRRIACDGVVFTGQFRPENALYMTGPFASDDLAPRIDSAFRCTDPAFFAAGNVLRPLKSSGTCWRQGLAAAAAIAGSML
ncbi:MAG: FAD-dependent oxidoreductase [Rhizobiales bacterium]|nr:FAD-dependent oxidoreductase [Hyphomicrobiales bacterium]MBI3673063.1 FAD-dependent oxidoreductase [Hyphomicrobiales bacterium]